MAEIKPDLGLYLSHKAAGLIRITPIHKELATVYWMGYDEVTGVLEGKYTRNVSPKLLDNMIDNLNAALAGIQAAKADVLDACKEAVDPFPLGNRE